MISFTNEPKERDALQGTEEGRAYVKASDALFLWIKEHGGGISAIEGTVLAVQMTNALMNLCKAEVKNALKELELRSEDAEFDKELEALERSAQEKMRDL